MAPQSAVADCGTFRYREFTKRKFREFSSPSYPESPGLKTSSGLGFVSLSPPLYFGKRLIPLKINQKGL